MVKRHTETELKFLVPAASRAALVAELERGPAIPQRIALSAMYLDTADRRLARAGMSWRLRREGRRWIQTLKGSGAGPLERFEHEVERTGPTHDVEAHAGTPLGDRLVDLVRRSRSDGVEVGIRFRTEVRRITRRVRTRGAVVDIAFDEGRLLSDGNAQRIREVEFELASGSTAGLLALAQRWCKQFALVYDPRSKAERGDRLAEGSPYPPLRKARRPDYARHATSREAYCAVLDECLSHITRNAIGVADGDEALRAEHVHQLRVGIRRLRSALRCFDGWEPAPPPDLLAQVRALFATLGEVRDAQVLGSGVQAELAAVGAPPLALPTGRAGADPVHVVRSEDTQHTLLAWIAWRASLACTSDGDGRAGAMPARDGAGASADAAPDAESSPEGPNGDAFQRSAERRLRRWHRRIRADVQTFDTLDEPSLHALRKRIKRQRYAVEFLEPLLGRKRVEKYLEALTPAQERMGELNDLFVARERYQALVASEPAAWFALGWLAARIVEVRSMAGRALAHAVKVDPPARGS